MADKAKPPVPVNTAAAADTKEHHELAGLRESEAAFIAKGQRLEEMDANEQAQGGVDLQQVKRNNDLALANVRKRIAKLSK